MAKTVYCITPQKCHFFVSNFEANVMMGFDPLCDVIGKFFVHRFDRCELTFHCSSHIQNHLFLVVHSKLRCLHAVIGQGPDMSSWWSLFGLLMELAPIDLHWGHDVKSCWKRLKSGN